MTAVHDASQIMIIPMHAPSSSFPGSLPRPPHLGHVDRERSILIGTHPYDTWRVCLHLSMNQGFSPLSRRLLPPRVKILFHIGNTPGISLSVSEKKGT